MFHMIEEMVLKCLLDVPFWTLDVTFWIVLPRDIFRNPIKSLRWSTFCEDS